ncbi:MAG: TonB-dependent receptor [Muribaculaceae bacterium]
MKRLRIHIFVVMAMLAVAGVAQFRIDSIQHLSQVVVVGNLKPYVEVIPAQTLSGKRLEGLNSHSVADAIRYFSGVQIKDYGGVGGVKTVDIRSMGTNHLGVFYDGIQLGNAQNGQIDLGKFSLDNIEEVTVYNGQKSEIFQSAKDFGSAGTVYLRSRRPRFDGDKRINANVTMRTGSFGLANPSLRIDYKLSQRVSSTVSAEYTYATGRYKFRYRKKFSDGTPAWDTTAIRRNGDIGALRVEGGLYGTLDRGSWNVKAYYYDSEKGIPGAIVNNVWKNSQRQWDRNFFVQGSMRKTLGERYTMMVNAKYAHDYMRYLNPDTTLMYIDNTFRQDELYVSIANRLRVTDGWDVNLSADYQWNHLNANLANFAYPTRHTELVALATAYRWQRFKAQASLLGTFVSDRYKVRNNGVELAAKNSSKSRFTPAVFVSYQPFAEQALTVRAFYKRVFRMPTFNDLYYTDMGNAKLNPEYATQYDIGAVYRTDFSGEVLRSVDVSVDGYYNIIDDKIIAVPKGTGQYRWMMMNIGKVKIRGIDVTGKVALSLPAGIALEGGLSYTYQRAQDYSDPTDCLDEAGSYKGQIAYIPRHSGSAIAQAKWRQAELNYSFIYVGERYHNSSNILANYEQPWYTHDLSAGYKFNFGKVALRAVAEVNNVFNQQYDVIRNYPMPGRNYKLILKFDI